jgi:hypothetical protein
MASIGLRSVGAVAGGVVVGVALTLATDAVLHGAGIFPPVGQAMSDSLFALATAYRTIYGVIGAYVTARLAPERPMRLALIGGFLGVAVTTLGAILTWNKGPAFGPHWYPVSLIVLAMPTAWVGGKIRIAQVSGSDGSSSN